MSIDTTAMSDDILENVKSILNITDPELQELLFSPANTSVN